MKGDKLDFATKIAKLQSEVDALESTIRVKEVSQYMQLAIAISITLIVGFLLFCIAPPIVNWTSTTTEANGKIKKAKKFNWFLFIAWTLLFSGFINGALYFGHSYGYLNFE